MVAVGDIPAVPASGFAKLKSTLRALFEPILPTTKKFVPLVAS
jgi:hypothetical protein